MKEYVKWSQNLKLCDFHNFSDFGCISHDLHNLAKNQILQLFIRILGNSYSAFIEEEVLLSTVEERRNRRKRALLQFFFPYSKYVELSTTLMKVQESKKWKKMMVLLTPYHTRWKAKRKKTERDTVQYYAAMFFDYSTNSGLFGEMKRKEMLIQYWTIV